MNRHDSKMTQTRSRSTANRLALTRTEVAEILGISVSSVDRIRRRGLLRASVSIRRVLYSIQEIERFLAETSKQIGV